MLFGVCGRGVCGCMLGVWGCIVGVIGPTPGVLGPMDGVCGIPGVGGLRLGLLVCMDLGEAMDTGLGVPGWVGPGAVGLLRP